MSSIIDRFSPNITAMIRMDHTHAIAAFHRYRRDASVRKKDALIRHVCLALEIHAQLEEEIFYPALRRVLPDNEVLSKSEPEHDEMRELIARLRDDDPNSQTFDENALELMRTVMHHVADEESVLLPAAEKHLAHELDELGTEMTKRRVELLTPHGGEAALTGIQTFPGATAAIAIGGLALAGALIYRNATQRNRRTGIARLF